MRGIQSLDEFTIDGKTRVENELLDFENGDKMQADKNIDLQIVYDFIQKYWSVSFDTLDEQALWTKKKNIKILKLFETYTKALNY